MWQDDELIQDQMIASRLRRSWPAFFETFGRLTSVQRSAIPEILEGKSLLISSATASGKTEAACAPLIERWYGSALPWTILYISPTRALVNDLYERLYRHLTRLGLSLKRRTGDYHDSLNRIPHVLLTTPESFDSLLCRGRLGDSHGHVLAHVNAVVLDEIHLLHGTARGEQLRWLLFRLKLLREYALKQRWIKDDTLQLIGLSATVHDPQEVAQIYLNCENVTHIPGGRDIEVINSGSKGEVEELLPKYIKELSTPEKILVFSNTRRRVDYLAFTLRDSLRSYGYKTAAHHGSLSKKVREKAEKLAREEKKIVLFATSTLEIGIDIGNIDLVVLDEPAPDIPALLQRIGRGNRRTNKTRVMTCGNSHGNDILHSAMIEASREGWLGKNEVGFQFAVARQQLVSYIFQAPKLGRSNTKVNQFLQSFLSSSETQGIIQRMVASGELIKDNEEILLGEDWLEKCVRGEIHSNIEALHGSTVVNQMNGEEIASGIQFRAGKGINTGGQSLDIKTIEHRRIEVTPTQKINFIEGDWSYTSRSSYKSSAHAQVLRRYLPLLENEWPVIEQDSIYYIFHLGGIRRSTLLEMIFALSGRKTELKRSNPLFITVDTKVLLSNALNSLKLVSATLLEMSIASRIDSLENRLGRPYANKKLSEDLRLKELKSWLNLSTEVKVFRESHWGNCKDKMQERILSAFIT